MRLYFVRSGLLLLAWTAFILACRTAEGPRVIIETAQGEVGFNVEVADDALMRAKGLMHRTDLKKDQGMFFIFPALSLNPFWMKNTPLSLDIIFISDDYRVLHVARATKPYSDEQIWSPNPYRYVLEVLAGTAEQIGLRNGDRIRYQTK